MRVEALKLVASTAINGLEPTRAESAAALAEAVDIAIGFFNDVRRIADASELIARSEDVANSKI